MAVTPSCVAEQARACYVHVPFCRHRCGYCNFTLVAGRDDLMPQYLDALAREFSQLAARPSVDSIFFGGGTPTHLPLDQLQRLLQMVREQFDLREGGEFSVEANPADVRRETVQMLARYGVTRVSLGAQSFHAEKLKLLERDHGPADIRAAFRLLADSMASVSLDLIFAAPGETARQWRSDLRSAARLEPQHISTYGLTFEKGTRFWSRLTHGQLREVDEETQRGMYLAAVDELPAAGWQHYEVSNFARPGHRCRHNESYWLGAPFYGFGPGAARFLDGVRELNHRSTTTYIRRMLAGQSPVAEREQLGQADAARERLVFALRRLEGVGRDWFHKRTGITIDQLVPGSLKKLTHLELLEDDGQRIRLTRKGLLLCDSVAAEMLGSG